MRRVLLLVWFQAVRRSTIILPAAILALMLALNPALREWFTWDRIGRNWTGEILLAAALTPVIITGGFDLSVGSVVGLSAVTAGGLFPIRWGVGWGGAGGAGPGARCGPAGRTLAPFRIQTNHGNPAAPA